MSTRKITIRVDKEDLSEVLREIKGDQIVSVTLELPDTKETYKYLSVNDKVLDWEFIEDETDEEEEVEEEHKSPKFANDTEIWAYDIISSNLNLYRGIEELIESTWRVCKKSPGIIFGTPLYMTIVKDELAKLDPDPTVERAILYRVIESYYSRYSDEEILSNLLDKIKTKWKELSNCETLTSVSILLFRDA